MKRFMPPLLIWLLLILILLFSETSSGSLSVPYSDTDEWSKWRQVHPEIVHTGELVVSEDGESFAVGGGEGGKCLYRTWNKGMNWTEQSCIEHALMHLVGSRDLSTLYMLQYTNLHIGEGYIWHSLNAGKNWSFDESPFEKWRSVACSRDGVLAAAAGVSGVWFSLDSAESWGRRHAGTRFRQIVLSDDGLTSAFLDNFDVMQISLDGGKTWSTLHPGILFYQIYLTSDGTTFFARAIALEAQRDRSLQGLYTSSDMGKTWKQLLYSAVPTLLAMTPDASHLCFCNSTMCSFTSNASAGVWQDLTPPIMPLKQIQISADGRTLVAVDNKGALWTTSLPSLRVSSSSPSSPGSDLSTVRKSTTAVASSADANIGIWLTVGFLSALLAMTLIWYMRRRRGQQSTEDRSPFLNSRS